MTSLIEHETAQDVRLPASEEFGRGRRSRVIPIAVGAGVLVSLIALASTRPEPKDAADSVRATEPSHLMPIVENAESAEYAEEIISRERIDSSRRSLDVTYEILQLGAEVVENGDTVVAPSLLLSSGTFNFVRSLDGTWVEQQLTPAMTTAGDGTMEPSGAPLLRQSFDGTYHATYFGSELLKTTEEDGGALPQPRFELTAYGSGFLVQQEAAANSGSRDEGFEASAYAQDGVSCVTGTCTAIVFERGTSAESFFESLPKASPNVERTELVYDDELDLAVSYRTYRNDVVTREFRVVSVQ